MRNDNFCNRSFYVLFGSQTGNGEEIANDVCSLITASEFPCVCQSLNTAKKSDLKNNAIAVIIICSTTGNGDAPENADLWWRSVKLRSAPKDMFQGVSYCVLGLGDTNYDKFCYMGKMIDKRMSELGGCRIQEVCCADEASNLEESVEDWKLKIAALAIKLYHSQEPVVDAASSCADSACEPDGQLVCSGDSNADCKTTTPNYIPTGLLNFAQVCTLLGAGHVGAAPVAAVPPCEVVTCRSSSKSKEGTWLILPRSQALAQSELELADHAAAGGEPWSAERPYTAVVQEAHWLTVNDAENTADCDEAWEGRKRVVFAQVDLGHSGITYEPGDSIGICCPNPDHLVDMVLARLQANEGLDNSVIPLSLQSVVIEPGQTETTLGEILRYRLDLSGAPRKASVLALAQHCSSTDEQLQLLWLCSKGRLGKLLWQHFVEAQRVGVAELLWLFPSCSPPLSALIACCGALPPRFYSIASSPLGHPQSVAIAFTAVRSLCGISLAAVAADFPDNPATAQLPRIRRRGVCTGFLEDSLAHYLADSKRVHQGAACVCPISASSADSTVSVRVRMFLKPTVVFRLPGSVGIPLILIGPGTGVAPFMGFLEHRAELARERRHSGDEMSTGVWRGCYELEGGCDIPSECNQVSAFVQAVPPGPIDLFFGCRGPNDYLFKQDLEQRSVAGVLTVLEVAMSRVAGAEKVYVTHKITQRGSEISRLILHDGAHIYICGDGNHMAKDVHSALRATLVTHGELSEAQAEELLTDMKTRRRYLLDIWS